MNKKESLTQLIIRHVFVPIIVLIFLIVAMIRVIYPSEYGRIIDGLLIAATIVVPVFVLITIRKFLALEQTRKKE